MSQSVTHIPAELRRLIVARAEGLCEYCLIAEADTYLIGEKHGGPTTEDNLAQACTCCNQAKGSDVGSVTGRAGPLCGSSIPGRIGGATTSSCLAASSNA